MNCPRCGGKMANTAPIKTCSVCHYPFDGVDDSMPMPKMNGWHRNTSFYQDGVVRYFKGESKKDGKWVVDAEFG